MKTLNQVNERIAEILEGYKTILPFLKHSDPVIRKSTRKLKRSQSMEMKRLVEAKLYLETKPREEFVLSELERLSQREKSIINGYEAWLESTRNQPSPESAKQYRLEQGLPDVKRQLNHLRFLAC